MSSDKPERDEKTITREKDRVKRPRRWKVVMHNDDYTTMEFVLDVLVRHFNKTSTEATHIMLQVHYKGIGTAGVYTRDLAESKVAAVLKDAEERGQPLKLTTEPE
ncbi:MAG: ATP-dependent Clp protease adaptor ClpS [Acidobacteria bacterium]|uniref:ATP-dependent Clp protease adapter protein ClpS n=1 Tax=Candidatus Polarisedimenticola svalbardensis TaxID=2886004 RepID=A0A8J7CLW2_9BACT|nr:ATP-dependent Clp protease adaptor ClpS [Candidatus Polarisedimenticola svalbardensis]